VASYVLILSFAARNLVLRGMGIVFIGIACNALVITLNQGMPVKIPADWQGKSWARATVKHHPQQSDDKLRFLSDIIVLKSPLESAISFGDLILGVGLIDVAYNASRKPKRRRLRTERGAAGPARRARRPRTVDLTQHVAQERLEQMQPQLPEERPLVLNHTRARGRVDWFDADDQEAALIRSRSTRSKATTTRSSYTYEGADRNDSTARSPGT
jgi:hypothetical protein